MLDFIAITLLISVAVTLVTIYFLVQFVRENRKHKIQHYNDLLPPKSSYRYFDYDKTIQTDLKLVGQHLVKHKVSKVVFVHGTFVGDDPFDIIHGLKALLPAFADKFEEKLKPFVLEKKDFMAKDLGNFPDKMVQEYQLELGESLKTINFSWSSSNHHLARVRGCFDLMIKLTEVIERSDKRILFLGHSHAGQVFALMSQMLANKIISKQLLKVSTKLSYNTHKIKEAISTLKSIKLDFVTMGTPPRYAFAENSKTRLLHLINHRGKDPLAGDLTGAIFTKSGDYIQQWGIAGSDTPPILQQDREVLKELDHILGTGVDLKTWKENIKYKKRVHEQGMSYLIDYKDSSNIPNAFKTIFGHGIYTRKKVMDYNLGLIAKYLYP